MFFTSYTLYICIYIYIYIYIATNGWCEWFTNTKVICYHMRCGALFTVRLMETWPSAKLPTLRRSLLDCFKVVWPANADCWVVELAMIYYDKLLVVSFLFFFLFFWDNYTLPTCGLPLIWLAYLWFSIFLKIDS